MSAFDLCAQAADQHLNLTVQLLQNDDYFNRLPVSPSPIQSTGALLNFRWNCECSC